MIMILFQINSFFDNLFAAEVFSYIFFGNAVKSWVIALGVFGLFLIAFKVLQSVISRRLKKLAEHTKTDLDDTLIVIIETIRPPFYFFLAFYLAINFLALSPFVQAAINTVLIIWVVYQAIVAVQVFINYIVRKSIEKEDKSNQAAIQTLSKIAKVVLWLVGALFILSNLGVNVSSVLAGLGIGGIAIALALQNILGDLFSSFAIFFDKPFVVGDFIVVGEQWGVVEKIGIKTTRLRSLRGEEIVISNRELTSTLVLNFKQMKERRVLFKFGVTYDTPPEKLREIPDIVKNIVQSVKLARFDRTHFKHFEDSSLGFEAVYYVEAPDYAKYMDINQEIHFKIHEVFSEKGISMAFPTRTVHLHKS